MNIVKLVPNWPLQLAKCIIVSCLFLLIPILFPVTFKATFAGLIPTLLAILVFNKINLRSLYCYEPGICYKRVYGVRYINREEIKSISFKPCFANTILKVSLLNGKNKYFYNWRLDDKTRAAIYKLYNDKVTG
jgi:hypothetical protein